ncbi:MAG: XRE family transcriptional regulator [Nevskiaceae bacterium]|nr:MAG: XRE family transcriptional regulator [Nevskiaceae bacterium]
MPDDLDLDSVPAFQLAAVPTATNGSWSLLKQRLKDSKQSAVAGAIGMDPGQFSNVLAGKLNLPLPKLVQLLDELGLKVVDAKAQVIDEQDFAGLARAAALLYSQAPHLVLKG